MKKANAMVPLVLALATCSLAAQTWIKVNEKDPMNDKAFFGFGLQGTLLSESVSQNGLPEIDIFCSKGDILYGRLLNHGFGKNLAYRQISNFGRLATPLEVRFNQDKKSWVFSTPHDLDTLTSVKFESKKEIKKILGSHTITFQTWDSDNVPHYMQFTIPAESSELLEACFKK